MDIGIGFVIKKALSAIVMPLPIGLILGVIGLWYLYRDKHTKAKIFLTITLLWIATISYTPFTNTLLSPLENSYKKLKKIPKGTKYILLLGGDKKNRAWEALRLYHKIPNATIITSGYAPFGCKVPAAISTANFLQRVGVPKRDIIMQIKPKTTEEEAVEIKNRLGKEPFILVTSAYHMPRAIRLFKKEGLNPIPAPTDFKIKSYDSPLSTPQGKKLFQTERAWHEYIGILWSSLRD